MRRVVCVCCFLFWLFSLSCACAQSKGSFLIEKEAPTAAPVYVYGSANEGDGKRNSVLLEQQGDTNPLGNPIQSYNPEESTPQNKDSSIIQKVVPQSSPLQIQENLPQNPQISPEETPQIINKQIQNTLYESGNRIYDIQSYPTSDIDYLEQPNVGNTITTYPAY